jgi:hypothetical protein
MPTEAGKVIADALQARRDIYDGKVRPDPHFVRLADPIFGGLVYNMADLILDPDALDRDDKLKIGFENLTATVDSVEALADKIKRERFFGNERYPYKQEEDAWRTTAHAMTETIGLLHELERKTAAPHAKPDIQLETNREGTMIFLSYSWKDEVLANGIDEKFQSVGINLTRDIRDAEYKQSMKEFMRKVRNSKFVVIILSKNYLDSSNCMYEIIEFVKDPDYKERIIPIIEKSANIFFPEGKVKYLQYWDNQIKKLNNDVKQFEPTDAIGIIEDLKHYKNISSSISEFLSIISDMNNIVVDKTINDTDFNTILKYIGIGNNFSHSTNSKKKGDRDENK